MSTVLSAHAIHEHIQSGRFAEAVSVIDTTNTSLEARREACTWVLEALKKAHKEPARDRGFLALVPYFISLRDAVHAFEAIDAIGTDLSFASQMRKWRMQLDTFADQQQIAIRQSEQVWAE